MPRITLLFASLHILMLLALAMRIVGHRRSLQIGLGDGGDRTLERKIRVHANFVENVPFALLMLGLLELNGLDARALWALGGTLLLARVLHAHGLSRTSGYSAGRFYGTVLTWCVLAGGAVAGVVLFATRG